ncbi:MAG TPA: TonB family protein [Pseudoxanthomonas sp.]|nr:TonB family protein [Pseudoxanthomonas sp.]
MKLSIWTPIALALALAVTATAHAGSASGAPPAPGQSVYTYALELDADGSIRQLVPHGFEADAVSRQLDREIGQWIFRASDAAAAPTRTFLRVVVAPESTSPQGFEVVSATTGPAPQRLDQPVYPLRDQMEGNEGTVVLELEIEVDGSVSDSEIRGLVGKPSRAMANAALAASRKWTFMPESVAGVPVAGTVLWPVCYLGLRSSVSQCAWTGPDAQRLSSKTVLTIDPAVTLVSPIAFQR